MEFRSGCPVASALDIIGDRWSLLIVRSLIMGAKSYGDLLSIPERISTNILADRLKKLTEAGILTEPERRRGSQPGAYRLTRKGAALLPVVQAMARWGEAEIAERWRVPDRLYAACIDDVFLSEERPA